MNEKAPLGYPFRGEPIGGRSVKYDGRAASPCAIAPLLCPKGAVIELKS
jgi:hypothetical protein